MNIVPKNLFTIDTFRLAQYLLGKRLIHLDGDKYIAGKIVETEAYIIRDKANHASSGKTKRNAVMFGPPGHLYIYKIYGVHSCMNVVTAHKGKGEAVLIRALEPIAGIEVMRNRRNETDIYKLCNGPGKLVEAMHITPEYNGHDITEPPLIICYGGSNDESAITITKRVGISQDTHRLLRFYLSSSKYISKK